MEAILSSETSEQWATTWCRNPREDHHLVSLDDALGHCMLTAGICSKRCVVLGAKYYDAWKLKIEVSSLI